MYRTDRVVCVVGWRHEMTEGCFQCIAVGIVFHMLCNHCEILHQVSLISCHQISLNCYGTSVI